MPQIDRPVIKERARRLREKGDEALRHHLDREIGARRRVLAESRALGRTEAVHAGASGDAAGTRCYCRSDDVGA
jgi:tRNA A37 methylthiotransferase MiaB